MFEAVLRCKICRQEIATGEYFEQGSREEDIDWVYNDLKSKYFKVCKNCIVPYLEQELEISQHFEGEMRKLSRKRQETIIELQKKLSRYKRFFQKQQARINAFAQEEK